MRYAASIPLTIKTPKGVLNIRAGQPFKVANNEFLLGLIKEGKVRPVQDIIKEEYRHYTRRLSEFPELNISAWPELNQEIQAATGKLNEAKENEDLPTFTQAKEKVLSLYMQALAYAAPHSVAVKVWSEVLQCFLWVVPDRGDVKAIRDSGVSGAIYAHGEVKALKGSAPEHLRAVHAAKVVFTDGMVKDSVDAKQTVRVPEPPTAETGGLNIQPAKPLPCFGMAGAVDYNRWHGCKEWRLKFHAGTGRLQRQCRHSDDWCLRLYQDGEKATIEAGSD
ncbi:MAG: hypothetical protein HQK97_08315 [Nitrospirae bacterium]|nr:hypothetical protein [Nitrospirota bacterium]